MTWTFMPERGTIEKPYRKGHHLGPKCRITLRKYFQILNIRYINQDIRVFRVFFF